MQVQKSKHRIIVRLSVKEQKEVRKQLNCEYEPMQTSGAMLLGIAPNLYEVVEAPYSAEETWAEPYRKCMSLVMRLRKILPSNDAIVPVEVVRSWVDPAVLADIPPPVVRQHIADRPQRVASSNELKALQNRLHARFHRA